ncbi:MAG: DUF4342 domain-containing protein [Peptococcaceae bacterium]|nr:DUF4342 domain-containing protein [Peptococcaceae bacterium]
MTDIEKIDLLRARLGVSYREAKEALDAANGDVVEALIRLEEQRRSGEEIMTKIREWVRRGGRGRIKIKKGDRTVFELPAAVGAVGVLGALASAEVAVLGVVGLLTAMSKNYTLEFELSAEDPEPSQQ